ncbi:MAG: ribosomal L7Ae/L30e/S12e/Gadd45 family protein [Selenomonadaceae bacterium]|nr:ribosomal L7Ae/L30e/S12e/Gadd45 family protein [Selenomonadaceae bacterium]
MMADLAESQRKITNLLSMAARARRIVSGSFSVTEAVKKGQAAFLLIAADAATETKNDCRHLAETYKVPFAEVLDRETLGQCLGKEYRAMAALTDAGFAKKLRQLLEEQAMR